MHAIGGSRLTVDRLRPPPRYPSVMRRPSMMNMNVRIHPLSLIFIVGLFASSSSCSPRAPTEEAAVEASQTEVDGKCKLVDYFEDGKPGDVIVRQNYVIVREQGRRR